MAARPPLEPDREALIVLDNCEHLVGACTEVAHALAVASPASRVVATSREPLGEPGEQTWRTPSLTLPPTQWTASAAGLNRWGAPALFVRRAELGRLGVFRGTFTAGG